MPQTVWSAPTMPPQLVVGVVDVWRADLAGADGERPRAALSPEERERAARFVRDEDGERWARAHGILRALLGPYTGTDPAALRFAEGPHGKPELLGSVTALRFNLSHSGDVALYAFALDREVGVDVELPRRSIDAIAIAERALGSAEAARLRALDSPQREGEFLRAWVRYEAALKCRGTGIGAAASAPAGPDPWICELDVGAPAAGALAVEGAPDEVRRWQWSAATAATG